MNETELSDNELKGYIAGILKDNNIVLIDIAPVYNGYPADYTINHVMGGNPDLEALAAYARDVSLKIARHVKGEMVVADVFLWTIEPYIMYKDRAAKFEQLVFIGKETVIL